MSTYIFKCGWYEHVHVYISVCVCVHTSVCASIFLSEYTLCSSNSVHTAQKLVVSKQKDTDILSSMEKYQVVLEHPLVTSTVCTCV